MQFINHIKTKFLKLLFTSIVIKVHTEINVQKKFVCNYLNLLLKLYLFCPNEITVDFSVCFS